VDNLRRATHVAFVAIAALAIVLAVNTPTQARGGGGHGFGGHGFGGDHPGGTLGHDGLHGHHGFDGHNRFRFGFGGPVYPYYGYYGSYPPAYGYEAPAYWYYCPTYGAYYPNVGNCPETWIPVPAS
jgi:hypothetical protein